jgi:hypothetical protein
MAIEPITVQNPLSVNPNNKNISQSTTSNSSSLEPKKSSSSDDLLEQSREKKEKDKLLLSKQAQEVLAQNLKNGNVQEVKTVEENNDTVKQALEFRGLSQIAERRDLTDKEQTRFNEIKTSFAEKNVSPSDILQIADDALAGFQQEAPALVSQLLNGDISGKQFSRLTQINDLLNRGNGFGPEEIEWALNTQVDQLTQKFNDALSQAKEQKLSRDDLSNLDKLQKEISSIQGYRLNVRDTIGPDGVVV